MADAATIERLALLKKFEFPTSMEEYKKSTLRELYDAKRISILGMSDEDLRKVWIEISETYPRLFERGFNCEFCSEQIILPIDLRRLFGNNYHGHCFSKFIQKNLNDATHQLPRNRYELEEILKIARVCHPGFYPEEPLNEGELEAREIMTRHQLERWYWTGEK